MTERLQRETVKSGVWLYGGTVEMSLRIIRQTWDQHFENGYDRGKPSIGEDGWAYYVVYGDDVTGKEPRHYSNTSRTCLSLEEAVALAESTIQGRIEWGRSIWKNDASLS